MSENLGFTGYYIILLPLIGVPLLAFAIILIDEIRGWKRKVVRPEVVKAESEKIIEISSGRAIIICIAILVAILILLFK